VFFKESESSFQTVFGSDRKYWSEEMKQALGLGDRGAFPYQLSPLGSKVSLPIPAVPFDGKAPSLKKIFNDTIQIYITPDQYFTTKFREIFQETKLRHTSAVESKHWLGGPDMKYWPQQLNFTVFCVTQGCGVSRKIFDSGVNLPPQIRAFYKFHVYFQVRRILFQLGGIQSMSALPGDPPFNQYNNHYDVASYKRIRSEFGIDPSSDFRFTHGPHHGLGSVYVYASSAGVSKTDYLYPGWNKFSDEGGKAIQGNLIYYIEPGAASDTQLDWFAPNTASGLTQAGLVRMNRSIEAFVYCVLGAQVNVRSSILGSGGRAREAQSEFLVLMESAITARPGRERAKVPARGGPSEGQAQSCCSPHGLAHAHANDNQHCKHDWLQQQAETGSLRDETWGEQPGKSRHKKSWAQTHGRRPVKN